MAIRWRLNECTVAHPPQPVLNTFTTVPLQLRGSNLFALSHAAYF